MKLIRIFVRSIRDSLKSFVRNFSLSLAAIMCVTITLLLVSFSLLTTANLNDFTNDIEDELNIIVYLESDITDERIEELKTEFSEIDEVESLEFKSKEEWKTEMSEYDETFATVLDYLTENPLLDSFLIKIKDVTKLSEVEEYISLTEGVNSAKYGEGMVEDIVSTFDIIQKVTMGLVIALVLVTAFLIGNTIKLTIFSRRGEIEIMRLVGASNLTIRLPFIFEGLLVGVVGSIIPVAVTIYGYIMLYTTFDGVLFTEMITLIEPFSFVLYVSLVLVIIGAVVGVLGSLNAVRKYLKI